MKIQPIFLKLLFSITTLFTRGKCECFLIFLDGKNIAVAKQWLDKQIFISIFNSHILIC